jgi:hypothetical protein
MTARFFPQRTSFMLSGVPTTEDILAVHRKTSSKEVDTEGLLKTLEVQRYMPSREKGDGE